MRTAFPAALVALSCLLAGCGRDAGQDVSPNPPQGRSTTGANPQAGGKSTGSGTGTTGGQGTYGTSTPTGPMGTGGGTTDTTPSGAPTQPPASAASR